MELTELDDALWGLRRLPPTTGRLGRALALLSAGGADASTQETLAALELLRTTAGLRAVAGAQARRPARAEQARRRRARQRRLPGIA